jgi:hypothetical protein
MRRHNSEVLVLAQAVHTEKSESARGLILVIISDNSASYHIQYFIVLNEM